MEVRISSISKKKKRKNAHRTQSTEYRSILIRWAITLAVKSFLFLATVNKLCKWFFRILSKWIKISPGIWKIGRAMGAFVSDKGKHCYYFFHSELPSFENIDYFPFTLCISMECAAGHFSIGIIAIVILLGILDSWQWWWCNSMNSLKFALFLLPCCLNAFAMSYFVKVMTSNQQFIEIVI